MIENGSKFKKKVMITWGKKSFFKGKKQYSSILSQLNMK
jgi:hypothetical protein